MVRVAVLVSGLAALVATAACGRQESAGSEPEPSTLAPDASASSATDGGQDLEPGPVVDRLNVERLDRELAPLDPEPTLTAIARDAAARVTERGSVRVVDLTSDGFSKALGRRGYEHRLLVVAYVVGGDEWRMADEWPAADSATWTQLLDPALRDVGVARGETSDGLFFLLLAAVSQNDAKAAEARGLSDVSAVRRRVLELTNELRREAGVVELVADAELDEVCQEYADRMLREGFYGHESPTGESAMDRVQSGRIAVRRAGENLGEGPPTPESVVQNWYDSPTHRRNLLHQGFRRMGLGVAAGEGPDGVYRILWVQMFTSARRPGLGLGDL